MKKTLLYIFAIPLGLIASIILPAIFSKVLVFFIPFESLNNFIDKICNNNSMRLDCGWNNCFNCSFKKNSFCRFNANIKYYCYNLDVY
ncbi:hypothetical protein M2254_000753 [Chryseobacterium sp. BIGb0186]|nr:hypothetical protein [Chryseobacterium sp. BIGb0186]